MVEIIKTCSIGLVSYKALKCFGKKDYADIIAFCTILYVGVMIISKVGGWYDGFMNSAFIQLMYKIFG